jgi:hypothetical protein
LFNPYARAFGARSASVAVVVARASARRRDTPSSSSTSSSRGDDDDSVLTRATAPTLASRRTVRAFARPHVPARVVVVVDIDIDTVWRLSVHSIAISVVRPSLDDA